jgi:hypothetical protein
VPTSILRSGPLVATVLTAVLAVGCSTDPAATVALAPEPAPASAPVDPSPEPTPEPPTEVGGEVVDLVVADLSVANSGLFRDGGERDVTVPADEAAIDTHVTAAASWLDTHLTDLQEGGAGLVAAAGLTGDPAELSEGLAAPDRPVDAARYQFTVGARGAPEWLRASVTLVRDGEADVTATFVFVPDGADGVLLVAAEPVVGAEVAADAAAEEPS